MVGSIIAVVLSVVLYILPCLMYWNSMNEIYKISRKKVLFIKFIVLTGLICGFVFSYPTKVMFYPWKSVLFIFIMIVIEIITLVTIIHADISQDIFDKLAGMWSIKFIVFLCLIIFAHVNIDLNYPKIIDNVTVIEVYAITEVDSESIGFVDSDGDIEKVLINDKNVQICFVEKTEDVRIERELKFRKYQEIYSKDQKISIAESAYTENYIIYLMVAE